MKKGDERDEALKVRDKLMDQLTLAAEEAQKAQITEAVAIMRYREILWATERNLKQVRLLCQSDPCSMIPRLLRLPATQMAKDLEDFSFLSPLVDEPEEPDEPEELEALEALEASGVVSEGGGDGSVPSLEAAEETSDVNVGQKQDGEAEESVSQPPDVSVEEATPTQSEDPGEAAPEPKSKSSRKKEEGSNDDDDDYDSEGDEDEAKAEEEQDALPESIHFKSVDDCVQQILGLAEKARQDVKTEADASKDGDASVASTLSNMSSKKKVDYSKLSKKQLKKMKRKEKLKNKRMDKQQAKFGLKFEDRLKEAINGYKGRDNLAASATGKVHMCLDDDDVLGFSVMGKDEYMAGGMAKIPRGKWTHIAITAEKPPKKKIKFYVDGVIIGHVDHVQFSYPMREIGDRDRCLNAYLLEARYWATTRSKKEINKFMYNVLPKEAPQDGLIGYWTFEEGRGQFVNDLSETRFRSKVVGKGCRWTPVSEASGDSEPPTPPCAERGICQVELKRARLATRGRTQLEEVECVKGCGEMMRRKDLKWHLTYQCPNRQTTCDFCAQVMPMSSLPEHKANKCPAVVQRNALLSEAELLNFPQECPQCGEDIPTRYFKDHKKNLCDYRLMLCELPGCGLRVAAVSFDQSQALLLSSHCFAFLLWGQQCRFDLHQKYYCIGFWGSERGAFLKRVDVQRRKNEYARPWEENMQIQKPTPGADPPWADPDDDSSDDEE